MKHDAINRAIAEHLESFTSVMLVEGDYDGDESPEGCWIWHEPNPGGIHYGADPEFVPRSFVEDPACSMMLLEKLLAKDTVTLLKAPNGAVYLLGLASQDGPTPNAKSLGEAIALAYCRAEGIEVSLKNGQPD